MRNFLHHLYLLLKEEKKESNDTSILSIKIKGYNLNYDGKSKTIYLKIKNNNKQIDYDECLINSLKLNLNYQKEIISKQNKIISNKNNYINNNKKVISKIKSKQFLQNKIFADKNKVLNFLIKK